MTRRTTPRAPTGLGKSGRELWRSVTADYDLDDHERLLLVEACRCADRLDRLASEAESAPVVLTNRFGELVTHPSMVEARQQAGTLAKLVASLRLPSGDEGGRPQRRGAARGSYGMRR